MSIEQKAENTSCKHLMLYNVDPSAIMSHDARLMRHLILFPEIALIKPRDDGDFTGRKCRATLRQRRCND